MALRDDVARWAKTHLVGAELDEFMQLIGVQKQTTFRVAVVLDYGYTGDPNMVDPAAVRAEVASALGAIGNVESIDVATRTAYS